MKIKDKVASWFISNIMIPKMEEMDKPGFIITRVSSRENIYLRDIFISESLISELERLCKEKLKYKGEKALYSTGKKFVFYYSKNSEFTKAEEKGFSDFAYFFVRYIEGTYAKRIDHKIDMSKKLLKLNADKYIVCSKNGLGYIFSEGSTAGIWSYAFQDYTIEAVQTKCQGRGDKECEIICAPAKTLKKMNLKFLEERNLSELDFEDSYKEMNKIRKTTYAKNSLEDLINSGFLKYSHGVVNYNYERFFLCEASFMYFLEKELRKLKGADKILFDVSFNWGKMLVQKEKKQDFGKFIMDFMSALGWGDILVLKEKGKYKVIIDYFPWTKFASDINFIMFRGMISGILSTDRKVTLRKIEKDTSQGYFSLWLSE